jgi:hypothetical protein
MHPGRHGDTQAGSAPSRKVTVHGGYGPVPWLRPGGHSRRTGRGTLKSRYCTFLAESWSRLTRDDEL